MKNSYVHKPRKGRKILKIFIILFIVFFLCIIVLYNYFTSAGFIRNHIFPKIEQDMNVSINSDIISIKPFSKAELVGFSIKTKQKTEDPNILSFKSFVIEYSLFSFIKGAPKIFNFELIDPKINILIYADGTTNLDQLSKKKPEEKKKVEKKEGKQELPDFNIANIAIKNADINVTEFNKKNEKIKEINLKNINYSLKDFSPGKDAKSSLTLNITVLDKTANTDLKNASLNLVTTLLLEKDLSKIKLDNDFSVKELSGKLQGQDASAFSVESKVKLVKENALMTLSPCIMTFKKGSDIGGKIAASGKYDDKNGEGEFEFIIDNINKTLLNLIAAGSDPIDFRDTSINNLIKVKITDKGKNIAVESKVELMKLSIYAPKMYSEPTKETDLLIKNSLNVNSDKQIVKIDYLDVEAKQGGRVIVDGKLSEPLMINLADMKGGQSEAPAISYNFNINELDLTQFKAMLPVSEDTKIDSAILNSAFKIIFENNGKNITLNGDVALNNLKGKAADTSFPYSDVAVKIDTEITDFAKVLINDGNISLGLQGTAMSRMKLNGEVDSKEGKVLLNMDLNNFNLTSLKGFIPSKDLALNGGNLNGKFTVNGQKNFKDIITNGDFSLSSFNCVVGTNKIEDLNVNLKVDEKISNFSDIDIKNFEVELIAKKMPAGNFKIQGKVDNQAGSADINIKSYINQNLFKSVQGVLPPDMDLTSMDFTYDGYIALKNKFSDVDAKGDLGIKKLTGIVNKNQIKDLDISAKIDKSVKNFTDVDLRNFEMNILSAGQNAGSVKVKGKINSQNGEGDLEISTNGINENTIALLSSYMPQNINIKSINLDYNAKMNFKNKYTDGAINGDLLVKNLLIEDTSTNSPLTPKMDVKLKHDIALGNPKMLIKSVQLDLTPVGKQTETINLTGEVETKPAKDASSKPPLNCKIDIKSNSFTVDNYLIEQKKTTTEKPTTQGTPEKKKEEELQPLDLKHINFVGNVDMKSIMYKTLNIKDLLVDSVLKDNILDMKKISMKINDAPVNSTLKANLGVPGWQYDVKSKLEKLNITPILEVFAPEKKKSISGIFSLDMDINGQGITQPNLEKNLKGTIKGDLADGKISSISILDALATITNIKELSELSFFKGLVDIKINAGKINIDVMDFVGNIERLGVKGWVGLDPEQKINLNLNLGLTSPLSNQLKKIQYAEHILETVDNFTILPVPIGMAGTFAKPKPSLNISYTAKETGKKVIKGLLLDELGKQLDKQTDKKEDKKEDKDKKKK